MHGHPPIPAASPPSPPHATTSVHTHSTPPHPQAHKFITGLAPVNAVVKVSSAVAALVAAPARQLSRRHGQQGQAGGLGLGLHDPFSSSSAGGGAGGRQLHLALQLRRSAAAFTRALVEEALAAGKQVGPGSRGAGLGGAFGGSPGQCWRVAVA